jgi:hypothetical protein
MLSDDAAVEPIGPATRARCFVPDGQRPTWDRTLAARFSILAVPAIVKRSPEIPGAAVRLRMTRRSPSIVSHRRQGRSFDFANHEAYAFVQHSLSATAHSPEESDERAS